MYVFIAVVMILAELGLAAAFSYLAFVKKRLLTKKSLIFLAPVFVICYALYMTASVYKGAEITLLYCFDVCGMVIDLFIFKFSADLLAPFLSAHPIFIPVFILQEILVVFTLVLGISGFFETEIKNRLRLRKAFRGGGDIVIGYSESALGYMENSREKGYKTALWVEKIDKTKYNELISAGYAVFCAPLSSKTAMKKLRGSEHHLIAFRNCGYSYVDLINFFKTLRSERAPLFLHIEAGADEMRIVRDKYIASVTDTANSFVTCFSRHELMAREFVTKYPISKFVPREFFDEDFALKPDKKINVAFIGFGKVGYELFKMLATQFQFAKKRKGGGFSAAPVNYYIYDRENRRLYNDSFFKLMKFDELFAGSDMPTPEPICSVRWPSADISPDEGELILDVNSVEAHSQLKALTGENDYTYFIVSLSGDLEDESYARSMSAYLGDKDNYKIFVRVKNSDGITTDGFGVTAFGDESDVLTHDCIVNDYLMNFSCSIDNAYNETSGIENVRGWLKLPVVEQFSNISNALSVPFKMGLLGFSVDEGAPTDEQTLQLFKSRFNDRTEGSFKKPYEFYGESSACNMLAFIEHSRWNAHYIFSDFSYMNVAAFTPKYNSGEHTPENIANLVHKNIPLLRHACLTDYYEGLDKLIRYKYLAINHLRSGGTLDEQTRKLFLSKKRQTAITKEEMLSPLFVSLSDLYGYDFSTLNRICDTLHRFGRRITMIDNKEQENAK